MSNWLSISEIARRWSYEVAQSAEALECELDAWFMDFVEHIPSQQTEAAGRNRHTLNRLMGFLGGRYLHRETVARYCEERGHAKPLFWFGGAQGRKSHAFPHSDYLIDATSHVILGYALEDVEQRPDPVREPRRPNGGALD